MSSDWPPVVVKETVTRGNQGGVEGGELVLYLSVDMREGNPHLTGYEPQGDGGRSLGNEANTRSGPRQLDHNGVGVASEHLSTIHDYYQKHFCRFQLKPKRNRILFSNYLRIEGQLLICSFFCLSNSDINYLTVWPMQ